MKLLIVDDEMNIRTGLQNGINWRDIGFEQVFIAANGLEALLIYKQEKPEIIITDIMMPGLDGLELSENIRRISEDAGVIILSGYSDFEYARKAVRFGVSDYLLKPVNLKDLLHSVHVLKEKISGVKRRHEMERRDRSVYEIKLIEEYLSGSQSDESKAMEIVRSRLLCKHSDFLYLLQFSIDGFETRTSKDGHEMNKIMLELSNKMAEQWHGENRGLNFVMGNNLVTICAASQQRNGWNPKQAFRQLHEYCNKGLSSSKVTVSSGVSSSGTLAELPVMYKRSEQALSNRLYAGFGQQFFYSDIALMDGDTIYYQPSQVKDIAEMIAHCNEEAVCTVIRAAFTQLKNAKCNNAVIVKNLLTDLQNLLTRYLVDGGLELKGFFQDQDQNIGKVPSYDTIDEYCAWVIRLYSLVLQQLKGIQGVINNKTIINALEFIRANFSKDITVELVADYVHKSRDHFSRVFKREMKISFTEYVTKIRIEEAKRLLRNTTLLAYEISEKVGFQDYKYFTQVFKGIEQVSPANYRKMSNESRNF